METLNTFGVDECRQCSDKSCQDWVDGYTGRLVFTKEGKIFEVDTPIKECKIRIFRTLYKQNILDKHANKH